MIISNKPDLQLCDNAIATSKYTPLTFIPKNLIEQFSKLANIYFLVAYIPNNQITHAIFNQIIAFLQMIPLISATDGKPVMFFPLSFILAVSALKDLFEDLKRHKEDDQENNSTTLKYQNDEFLVARWKDLRVGDIIKVST